MPNAEMVIYSCIYGTHRKHGFVQHPAEFGKPITVRNDSGVVSDNDAERLGAKLLQDEPGCQISTNFKLTASFHLSHTPLTNNVLINTGHTVQF